jgi:hypothetical protein
MAGNKVPLHNFRVLQPIVAEDIDMPESLEFTCKSLKVANHILES